MYFFPLLLVSGGSKTASVQYCKRVERTWFPDIKKSGVGFLRPPSVSLCLDQLRILN